MKTATIVPAGTYWVGDPCYSVPGSDWHEWLDAAGNDEPNRILLEASLGEGRYAVGLSTMWGDGEYFDQNRRPYDVDAGLIGLVDVRWEDAYVEAGIRPPLEERSGTRYRVTLDNPTKVGYDEATGEIYIGKIVIETDPDDPVDEDLYERECVLCGAELGWDDTEMHCSLCAEED